MEQKEIINNFAMRITHMVNQVKAYGETILEKYVVANILCSLMPRFNNIVMAIEESKDITTMIK